MDTTSLIPIAAAVAGGIAGWLLTRTVLKRSHKAELAGKEASDAALLEQAREAGRQQLEQLNAAHAQQIALLKDMQEKNLESVRRSLKAETEEILKKREEELSKGNKENLDAILTPLKESIREMKTAMDKNAEDHLKNTTSLSEQLKQAVRDMQEKTNDIGSKAESLSVALTGKPKVQGCFGENLLDGILANEGLIRGMHYTKEDANDDRSRPDFVFHFKEGLEQKDLVVDSKVSLTAFVKYMNATDEQERKSALNEHLASIRGHISELAKKDYAGKIRADRRFADYVLMFMPIDMAFRVALDAVPTLWQEAYNKGVLITTEQTIMPFLKIMQLTWNKFRHDSSMNEIVEAAGRMIDRVALFYDSYEAMGKNLQSVVNQYNSGLIKLKEGGASITTAAKQVESCGARLSKGKSLELEAKEVNF